jgi:hypothetical protein
MNGWFSRSAVAKDLTLAQHFISCERTQHELSTSAVGSLRTFAATHNDDCNADLDEAALAAMVLVAGVLR